LEISTFTGLTGEEEAAFRRIYESSFPATERADTGHVLATVAAGGRLAYKAGLGGSLVGFGLLMDLAAPNALYLEYLAVDPDCRSHGVGTALLRGVCAHLARRPEPPTGLVFEVEPPEGPPDAQADRRRRIRFYQDNGATLVTGATNYVAPDLAGGGQQLSFMLMWLPIAGAARLEGEPLLQCVSAILVDGYGLAPEDPFVRRVLDDLSH
jgi:ribosomal protein S18 acetylase RimI-like enzyme